MNTDDYIRMSRMSIEDTQKKVRREIEKYMKKSDIKRSTGEGVNHAFFEIGERTGEYNDISDREAVSSYYSVLSEGKIKGNTMKKAMKYAEVIYQPETHAILHLMGDTGIVASLHVVCTLPEHVQGFANYWIGKDIESHTIQNQVNDFKRKLSSLRVSNVEIENYNGKSDTIKHITCDISYQ
ncbi:hypothetical protein GF336_00370 [Candidatus Woesearchaeota archaeon]|nr:hypothetical protein [Candidatus Woesearchaeota archaeon]